MKRLKIAIIGLGNMGSSHVRTLISLDYVELVGVCDIIEEKADKFAEIGNTTAYYNHIDLFNNSGLEAVMIVVPHYDHTPISIEAFGRGLHVLCEKPIAVHVNDARKMIASYNEEVLKFPNMVFAIMLQERTLPFHKKLKDIVMGGELGRLMRVTWINTKWFRSQTYYNSGGWRATWAGEGGGILTNQCPHNLDLYQWLFGLPSKITGHANIGKYHDIEVEDEVSAYFSHDNGMIGHFIVNTIESPGTNRLEIVGEYGNVVYENDKIIFNRNRESILKFCKETKEGFGSVECWPTEIPVDTSKAFGHKVVIEKFVDRVLQGKGELVAEGVEGINGLTLGNGIMLSSFTGKQVDVPFDTDEYERRLAELKVTSTFVKTVEEVKAEDLADSFSK